MDSSQPQMLLHKTPAAALIEERFGGTKTVGGIVVHYHLYFQQVSRLKIANCKNLWGQNVWHSASYYNGENFWQLE